MVLSSSLEGEEFPNTSQGLEIEMQFSADFHKMREGRRGAVCENT